MGNKYADIEEIKTAVLSFFGTHNKTFYKTRLTQTEGKLTIKCLIYDLNSGSIPARNIIKPPHNLEFSKK